MITTIILTMLYGVIWLITAPFRLLPDVSLPAGLASAISTANGYIASIDFMFPTSTFLIIFGIMIVIESFITLFKIINWVIRKIPGIN